MLLQRAFAMMMLSLIAMAVLGITFAAANPSFRVPELRALESVKPDLEEDTSLSEVRRLHPEERLYLPYNVQTIAQNKLTEFLQPILGPVADNFLFKTLIGNSVSAAAGWILSKGLGLLKGLSGTLLPIFKVIRAIVCLIHSITYLFNIDDGAFINVMEMILDYANFFVYEFTQLKDGGA